MNSMSKCSNYVCYEDTSNACKQNIVTKSHQNWTNKLKSISSLNSHQTVFWQSTHTHTRIPAFSGFRKLQNPYKTHTKINGFAIHLPCMKHETLYAAQLTTETVVLHCLFVSFFPFIHIHPTLCLHNM